MSYWHWLEILWAEFPEWHCLLIHFISWILCSSPKTSCSEQGESFLPSTQLLRILLHLFSLIPGTLSDFKSKNYRKGKYSIFIIIGIRNYVCPVFAYRLWTNKIQNTKWSCRNVNTLWIIYVQLLTAKWTELLLIRAQWDHVPGYESSTRIYCCKISKPGCFTWACLDEWVEKQRKSNQKQSERLKSCWTAGQERFCWNKNNYLWED